MNISRLHILIRPLNMLALHLIFIFILFSPAFSQTAKASPESNKNDAPKVFIDCGSCDMDFLRTEITFVNFVRERLEAHVHILITTQETGSGGTEYTITLYGQKEFKGIDDTLKFFSNSTDSDDGIRKKMVNVLKMGLMQYIARTPIADKISISMVEKVEPIAVEDKWNFWVFSISVRGSMSGEQSMRSRWLSSSFSADRVTPQLKIKSYVSASSYKDEFDIENETITGSSRSQYLSTLIVKSINEHWSAGGWVSASSSTYSNIKLSLNASPAMEYNFFPYSESTRRELRMLYKAGCTSTKYREETIYDKMEENLFRESLTVTLELKEKWGSISTACEGSHYFHDTGKNRITLYSELSLKLFKGFSFDLYGTYSRIHDLLSLPKGGATYEEILLRRTQLATNYDYYVWFGFSYTFGSIYSNVVNPRFE